MRSVTASAFILLLLASGVAQAQRSMRPAFRPTSDVDSLAKSLVGKTFWLRIDVLRVQYWPSGGSDATNVFSNKEITYRSSGGKWGQSQAPSAEELAADIRKTGNNTVSTRIWAKGSEVKVHSVSYTADGGRDVVKVDITEVGKAKSAVRFQFERGTCTVPLLTELLGLVLAESQKELEPTVQLDMGMELDAVLKAKGQPKTRVDMGDKTILQYEGLKLIFKAGKLENVE